MRLLAFVRIAALVATVVASGCATNNQSSMTAASEAATIAAGDDAVSQTGEGIASNDAEDDRLTAGQIVGGAILLPIYAVLCLATGGIC